MNVVFLDAGGVLVDESSQENVRAAVMVETLAGVVPGYDLDSYWSDVDRAVESRVTDVYRFIFEANTLEDVSLRQEFYSRYLDLWEDSRPPLQLAHGILGQLTQIKQNYRIGYAGQYGHDLFDLLEAHNVLHEFCVARTEEEVGAAKPDPEYYRRLAKAAECDPSECIMVGDRIDKDIAPARAVGMKTILVRTGLHRNQKFRTDADRPDIVIESLESLTKALAAIA